MADWSGFPSFTDVIVYVQGIGPPNNRSLQSWAAKNLGPQWHTGGQPVRVGNVRNEYIREGKISNKRRYCGGGKVADRELFLIQYTGGDDGYGRDPTNEIIGILKKNVTNKAPMLGGYYTDLGRVMVKGSSGGTKAALRVAQYLCENHHVDYIGIHDGGSYPPWSSKTAHGDDVQIRTVFDLSAIPSALKWNWYQSWGNKFDEEQEKHGQLSGFTNRLVSVKTKVETDTPDGRKAACDAAHMEAVAFGEAQSDIFIKTILDEIDSDAEMRKLEMAKRVSL